MGCLRAPVKDQCCFLCATLPDSVIFYFQGYNDNTGSLTEHVVLTEPWRYQVLCEKAYPVWSLCLIAGCFGPVVQSRCFWGFSHYLLPIPTQEHLQKKFLSFSCSAWTHIWTFCSLAARGHVHCNFILHVYSQSLRIHTHTIQHITVCQILH